MKYALLDTDFISKTHTVRIDDKHHLIDCIIAMQGYLFMCHEQTIKELKRYNSHAPVWIEEKIKENRIRKYTDNQILNEMSVLYGKTGPFIYTAFLKSACGAFGSTYFDEKYGELEDLDNFTVSLDDYLVKLRSIEAAISEGNNLGEIKSYVLLQWLNNQLENQLYYFCSDDKNARNGILALDGINVKCITLVSSLLRIHNETGVGIIEMEPYIQAMLDYFNAHDRKTIRVIEATPEGRFIRVDCKQVLREIFEDKFVELSNGFLKYN